MDNRLSDYLGNQNSVTNPQVQSEFEELSKRIDDVLEFINTELDVETITVETGVVETVGLEDNSMVNRKFVEDNKQYDHSDLTAESRNLENSHPIEAITGLLQELTYLRGKVEALEIIVEMHDNSIENLDGLYLSVQENLTTEIAERKFDISSTNIKIDNSVQSGTEANIILQQNIDKKQDILNTNNIKTINGESLLGAGNIIIE